MDPWGVVHDSPGTASRHTPCRKMVCTLHTIMRTAGCARVGWEYARAHAWPRPWRPCGICGIYIYMYIGVGEPQWQVGPRVVIWIAVEYPRWCSLAKIGRLDIKRGCIFFFKLFIELDDFRKIANRHFSSFRIPIFIDDWVIYKTKVLNLSNCIDILKFLFSKRNLLIDNGGVEFWESKKPAPKVSQRRAHPIAPNRAWPLSGSCSTPSVANNSPKMKRIERGHDRKVQSTLYTRRTRHIAPSSPTIIYEAGLSFPSPGSSIAIIVAHPLWSVPRPRARAPCT